MLTALLLAQLIAQGPPCGYWLGAEITPENTPLTGCFIPSWRGDGSGAQLRIDQFSPSGLRATPVPPTPWPQFQPAQNP